MKKFVINLKRRPDRLKQFLERCPYTDLEIVYGFDAKNPHLENKKERKIFDSFSNSRKVRTGARGVWISHLRIWKKMVDTGIQRAMIFEDDALFNENFEESINDLNYPESMNILFIGGRFTKNFIMPPEYSIKSTKNVVQSNFNNFNGVYHDRTAHGYIITFDTAKLLIEIFKNTRDPDEVDHFIIRKLRSLEIPVHNSVPLLCYSPIVGDSDIR